LSERFKEGRKDHQATVRTMANARKEGGETEKNPAGTLLGSVIKRRRERVTKPRSKKKDELLKRRKEKGCRKRLKKVN